MITNTLQRNYPATGSGRFITVCFILAALSGCGGGGEVVSSPTHSDTPHSHALDGRFSASSEGIWPPHPRKASNSRLVTAEAGTTQTLKSKITRANKIAMQDVQVQHALGDNFEQFSTHLPSAKNNPANTSIEFYKYDSNEVITVGVSDDNTINIHRRTADRYQPPESKLEAKRAIELAALALKAQGYNQPDNLNGTALLAYPSAAEVADSGRQFYAERLLYVTFGPGQGKAPHFRALVNLSRDTVVNSRPIQ